MIACRDIAREHGLVMQTHVSEAKYQAASTFKMFGISMAEVDGCVRACGALVLRRPCHLDQRPRYGPARRRGAQVSHNRRGQSAARVGHRAVREYHSPRRHCRHRHRRLGLSDNQNMFEAMRAAAFVSRIRGLPPADWISTAEAFIMATEGSARVLGMQDFIGKIAKGYKADLVLLDLDHVNFVPLNNATNQIVFTEDGGAVDKVLIGGKLVVAAAAPSASTAPRSRQRRRPRWSVSPRSTPTPGASPSASSPLSRTSAAASPTTT